MTSVEYLPAAETELNAAAAFYEEQAAGLGLEFLGAVEAAEQRVVAYPELGTLYAGGARRLLLSGFPFGLVYRARSEHRLEVIAVMHLHRRPDYWRRRL